MKNMSDRLVCWVVSLDPEAENAQKLVVDLRAQGVAAEFFAGIDGRGVIPRLEGRERLNKKLALVRHGKELTPSELGCYLSHLRAIKKAYSDGAEYICLLEDDVVIEPDFAQVLRELVEMQLDLVRLMSLRLRRRKVIADLGSGYSLVRPLRGGCGTQSFLMSRAGMKKFIRHAEEIYEPVDKVIDHFFLYDLKVFAVEPHIAYELERPTSVEKLWSKPARKLDWRYRMAHHPVKLWFSIRRHWYRICHRSEFSGGELPSGIVGKTRRLR